jgi:hypothetical protein
MGLESLRRRLDRAAERQRERERAELEKLCRGPGTPEAEARAVALFSRLAAEWKARGGTVKGFLDWLPPCVANPVSEHGREAFEAGKTLKSFLRGSKVKPWGRSRGTRGCPSGKDRMTPRRLMPAGSLPHLGSAAG